MNCPEKLIIEKAGIGRIGKDIVWTDTTKEGRLFGRILTKAKAWDWLEVEILLNRLYAMVGAKNKHTGYAFHVGRHPLLEHIQSMEVTYDW